ncbi:BTB/POZ-like protein [Metarhizium brunneum]
MEEAIEGKVKWESVDEDTFVCFWQYAYTGNYDIHSEQVASEAEIEDKTIDPDKVDTPTDTRGARIEEPVHPGWANPVDAVEPTAEPGPEPATVAEVDDPWGFASFKKGKKKKKCSLEPPSALEPSSKQGRLWAKFVALRRTSDCLEANHTATEAKLGAPEAGHLLSHAKVYVFADCYGMTQLMTLSYNKLHQSLVDLNLHAKSLADVVALAEYSYDMLVPDDLKELVNLFAACEVERLWKYERFQTLLDTHAGLGKAVIAALLTCLEY